MRTTSDPTSASMRWMAGSPTRKRRAEPAAMPAFTRKEISTPVGAGMAANCAILSCIANPAATARRSDLTGFWKPVKSRSAKFAESSNQQVMASPAKPITLPPKRCTGSMSASNSGLSTFNSASAPCFLPRDWAKARVSGVNPDTSTNRAAPLARLGSFSLWARA